MMHDVYAPQWMASRRSLIYRTTSKQKTIEKPLKWKAMIVWNPKTSEWPCEGGPMGRSLVSLLAGVADGKAATEPWIGLGISPLVRSSR